MSWVILKQIDGAYATKEEAERKMYEISEGDDATFYAICDIVPKPIPEPLITPKDQK